MVRGDQGVCRRKKRAILLWEEKGELGGGEGGGKVCGAANKREWTMQVRE